jgi:hypothetical protein
LAAERVPIVANKPVFRKYGIRITGDTEEAVNAREVTELSYKLHKDKKQALTGIPPAARGNPGSLNTKGCC